VECLVRTFSKEGDRRFKNVAKLRKNQEKALDWQKNK
jgi:hypothetical protein